VISTERQNLLAHWNN